MRVDVCDEMCCFVDSIIGDGGWRALQCSPQKSARRLTFQNGVAFLPANVPQDGVDSVNSVGSQDALVNVCAHEPCDPLVTGIQGRWVFQPHKLVWAALDLIHCGFTSPNDRGGCGPVRA